MTNSLIDSNNKRYHYIDVAKGIGILLVVFQHCLGGGELGVFFPSIQKAIASFHMPFFFFISGFLYLKKDSREFLYKKMINLVYPFVIIQILNWLLSIISTVLNHLIQVDNLFSIVKLEGYWFIETLLYIILVYYWIDSFLEKKQNKYSVKCLPFSIKIVISIVFLIIGLGYSTVVKTNYSIVVCSLIGFFYFELGCILGNRMKKIQVTQDIKIRVICIFAFIILIVFETKISEKNSIVTMARNEYGSPFYFLLTSILGIAAILCLSYGIFKNDIIEFFGRNSLIILTTQFPVYRLIMLSLNCMIVQWSETYNKLICFCVTVILEVIVIKVINRFFPTFAGRFVY